MNIPDKEARMHEVKQLAEKAREGTQPTEGGGATGGASARGLFAPLTLAPAHEGIPSNYVLHIHTQVCNNCSCGEMYSEFYAQYRLKSRMGGKVVTHLRRCDKPLYDLPVLRIPVTPTRIPFCSECETLSLSHLPPPPEEANLTELPEPTNKLGRPKAEKPKPRAATLEELI